MLTKVQALVHCLYSCSKLANSALFSQGLRAQAPTGRCAPCPTQPPLQVQPAASAATVAAAVPYPVKREEIKNKYIL